MEVQAFLLQTPNGIHTLTSLFIDKCCIGLKTKDGKIHPTHEAGCFVTHLEIEALIKTNESVLLSNGEEAHPVIEYYLKGSYQNSVVILATSDTDTLFKSALKGVWKSLSDLSNLHRMADLTAYLE